MAISSLQYQIETLAELLAHPNVTWSDIARMELLGHTSKGDGFHAFYIWDLSSSAAHNFPFVIKQTGAGATGRWILYVGQADWNSTTPASTATILNKPSLHAIATSGDYNDLSNKPAAGKRHESFTGTTNASGNYSVTFAQAFTTAPDVQAQLINPADNDFIRVTSITTTGCVVNARRRTDVVGLLPSFSNLNGASVTVLITER